MTVYDKRQRNFTTVPIPTILTLDKMRTPADDVAEDGLEDTFEDDVSDSDLGETSSNYSSVSEDSLPPIHAYGHTYHGSGRLLSPNDASEARRMQLQHELFKLCLDGGLVDAKLGLEDYTKEDEFQVLDVGSGSGLWACEMAARYPHVDILGTDLSSALLPKDVPPNVTFEIADAVEEWPDRTYDFIHMRNLVGGGIRDWEALLCSAFAHLRPGGQLEFTEIRPRFFDADPEAAGLPKGAIGTASLEYEKTYGGMCVETGIDFDPVPKVPGWLSRMGAERVRERVDWVPVRNWGSDERMRKKGKILGEMVECGLENWTLRLFGMCGWEERDTRALLDRVKREVQDPLLRSYVKV
ncbi:Fc.00g057680.m01.CDS01 [Cosmosporella sp. VM-42]